MPYSFVDQIDLEFWSDSVAKTGPWFHTSPSVGFRRFDFLWFLIEDSKSNGATLKRLKTKIFGCAICCLQELSQTVVALDQIIFFFA